MAEAPSLAQVLARTSEFLFPAELGKHAVTLDSRSSDGDTPLHVLVWQNDLEGVQVLLAAGADINAQGDMGYTPLHVAVAQWNAPLVELLLRAGARSDVTSEFGSTAHEVALRTTGEIAAVFARFDGSGPD